METSIRSAAAKLSPRPRRALREAIRGRYGKIIIKDEPLYNKYPSDFPLIQSFHKLIELAVKKAQKKKSTYASIIAAEDYTLQPDYYHDFGHENPFITVELYTNDDEYISMSDNQEKHTEAIGRVFSSIIPRTQQADLRYGICARSLGPVGDTDQWRANPFYRFRDEVEIVDQNTVEKIWMDGSALHIFISHKAEKKERAHNLKKKLADFGISSFVAHDDIAPTEEVIAHGVDAGVQAMAKLPSMSSRTASNAA
jgi:hypothetical protein